MKQNQSHLLTLMLLAMLSSMLSLRAYADPIWVDDPSSYSVTQYGTNTVKIKVPVYNKDGYDEWIDSGKIYYQINGSGSKTKLLYWCSDEEDISGSASSVNARFSTDAGGEMKLLRGFDGVSITSGERVYGLAFNGSDKVYAEIEWTVPLAVRGKSLTISWDVTRDGNMRDEIGVSIGNKTINIPAKTGLVDPIITSAILSQESDHAGQLIIPWMISVSDDNMRSSRARYKNADKEWVDMKLETKSSGYIYLDATEPHDSLHVIVDYISKDKEGDQGDLIQNRKSDYYNVPMIHKATRLKATPVDDGKATVKLEWVVENVNKPDYLSKDQFQLQRSISGKEEDFVDIATISYVQGQEHYSFEDNNFLEKMQESDFGENGFIHPAYRLRRSLSSVWGWSSNPLVATCNDRFPAILLYQPINATGDWDNEGNHTVKVKWDYKDKESGALYVWDNRAEMSLLVRMYRRDGTLADSVTYILTPEEVRARSKVISLTRSCVNYDITLLCDETNSPVKSGLVYMEISSAEDFVRMVTEYKGSRINAKQTQDFEVPQRGIVNTGGITSVLAMDEDWEFSGVYDGNGHTITLPAEIVSLFTNLTDATVKNLTVSGQNGNKRRNRLGWAAMTYQAHNVTFENCVVRTETHSRTPQTYGNQAGFVLFGDTITFKNCLYAGRLDYTSSSIKTFYRGFVRDCDDPTSIIYDHAVYAPMHPYSTELPFSELPSGDLDQYLKTAYVLPNNMDSYPYEDIYKRLPSDIEEQLQILGSDWTRSDEYPYFAPVFKPESDERSFKTELAVNAPKFYFQSNGRVSPNSLTTETRQSSVMLTWSVEGGVVDYFQVLRRIKGKEWEIIAPYVTDLGYEDTTASPIVESYEYMVRSAVDCEGTSYQETQIEEGHCKNTGMIEGYVHFKDGTGVPGIKIEVASKKGGDSRYTETDETGHYEMDLLSYNGEPSATYVITPVSGSQKIAFEGSTSLEITFDDRHNYYELKEFVISTSSRFSGIVMYEGTTIPVKGVQFEVNGHKVNASTGKPVETDSEGRFSFHVFNGNNKIQAVMDGHKFYEDGWFKGEKGKKDGYDFDGSVADIYFYDETKVKLIGRVAGGHDQEQIPLGNSLSTNNLGDSIVMVLTLEGDNKSKLVYDNTNPLKEKTEAVYTHTSHDKAHDYQTKMITTRRNITVIPDKYTGEYSVLLPPVRWKVQQIYATGYPTLFPNGKTSDVIDLTDALAPIHETYEGEWINHEGAEVTQVSVDYNAKYNRIWHAPTELSYEQLGFDQFGYFGDLTYISTNLLAQCDTVPLAYKIKEDGPKNPDNVGYTFGHPVFSIERQYPFQLSAVEKYYWNNNHNSDSIDIVHLKGGKVTIHNGFISSMETQEVDLDDNGQALVTIKTAQVPYLLKKEDALRTLTMTLTMDGTTFEAKPLDAYIMNIYEIPGAPDVISTGTPVLVDVLRDPPGGGSSAKLSRGATLKKEYKLELEAQMGLKLNLKSGSSEDCFTGVVTAPTGMGVVMGFNQAAESDYDIGFDFVANVKGERAFSYTMTTKHDISTSDDEKMVGANADIYMGFNQDLIATPASTIRAIPASQFKQLEGRLASGRMIVIAQDRSGDDANYYLVRDEALSIGSMVTSTFTYTQSHIINTIIPTLTNQCKEILFTGTEAEAKALANKTNDLVYLSLRDKDDSKFGVMNIDPESGEYVSYTSTDNERKDMNYRIILPDGKDSQSVRDSVFLINQTMLTWLNMIAQNEREKLSATDLVNNFDIDGGVGMEYSESFESEYSNQTGWYVPILSEAWDPYIGEGEAGNLEAIAAMFGPIAANLLGNIPALTHTSGSVDYSTERPSTFEVNINFTGSKLTFKMEPVFSYDVKQNATESKNYSREESFSIKMDKKSHLNVSVYRARAVVPTGTSKTELDVFSSENFYNLVNYDKGFLDRQLDPSKWSYAKSFVYRTNGGATCRPYEGERKTLFYMAGQTLDKRTKQIEKPVIRLDKQSISGVPYGEPARFKVYMTNESEEPESAYPSLNLSLDDQSNPFGARLTVDGFPVTWGGTEIGVTPGEVTEKTLEVYAGEGFDYEGLTICLMSCTDNTVSDQVSFDVHFLRTAGPVNISQPGDKWVMNTESPYDKKGYHIPVVIDGFDKNQPDFDHIEFQYKESSRGEEYWTNLCSYYAKDSLYNLASGVKAMIPDNGNINTEFFGEGEIIEKAYDLRAVLFCRNGNEFLTTPSKVLSGVKDTRRPQLFGTPEPVTGIIDIGDNIVFNFSEDIEYNYLSDVVNFEVKGEVNNDAVTQDVSLLFDGEKSSVETEARRNFNGKDVTIDMLIKPNENNKDMPLFSHGTNGKKLQLWLTEKRQLRAIVGDEVFTTDSIIKDKGFTQVAMVISQPEESDSIKTCHIALYKGGTLFMKEALKAPYTGVGPLIFGRTNEADRSESKFYEGRMMEARVWYRALTGGQITMYGNKRLSGYEMGLVDYYPMNEGSGLFALDKAQGANAHLQGASWAMPHGMSLKLDFEDRGIALDPNTITRTSEDDYTLMLWFKTNSEGRGTLISNGAGMASNIGAESQYCIGFESEKLMYRTNGFAVEVPGDYSDNEWHHYAMTVNRAKRVANIYVDAVLKASFPADSLGSISGGTPMLGGAVYKEKRDGETTTLSTRNWFQGHLDEICLFEQALPLNLIKAYMSQSPSGEEAGLLTYISFDRQERQKDNDLELKPYVYSRKVYKDDDGNLIYEIDRETQKPTTTLKRDYPFAESVTHEMVLNHIDETDAAAMKPYLELKNLKFSYAGRGNQIMVNIDEHETTINKRNIYVTMRDIPDLNGNVLASPVTACYFVDCSPVRWKENNIRKTAYYGYDSYLSLSVMNSSSVTHTYTIENCPKWLKFENSTNVISPNQTEYIDATVSRNLNVGSYDEVIYLVDENGMTEPLYLNVTVEGEEPAWAVSGDMLQHTMNVIGEVTINGEIDIDSRDLVGVFDSSGICHGVAHIDYSEEIGESRVYLTVYDNVGDKKDLFFKLWNYATGLEMLLTVEPAIKFVNSAVIGSDTPVSMKAGLEYVQNIKLKKGWNWVSFNVSNENLFNLNNLLDKLPWKDEDVLTDLNSDVTMVYTNGHWRLSGNVSNLGLSVKSAYAVKVQDDIDFPIAGAIIKELDTRTIYVKQGWNGIGYTPMMNLSVETALADYHDKAEDGDVIKSHTEFAVFQSAHGVGHWKGDLKYMKPGEGYMLYRKKKGKVSFWYPFFEPGSTFLDDAAKAPAAPPTNMLKNTMSVSAVADGLELEPGDRLLAYADAELRGAALADEDGVFYLTVGGSGKQPLWMAIEREGEIIAATGEVMAFESNAVMGTPNMPTHINFVQREIPRSGWYTLDGIRLNSRPTKKGVYIYNGKKRVIE